MAQREGPVSDGGDLVLAEFAQLAAAVTGAALAVVTLTDDPQRWVARSRGAIGPDDGDLPHRACFPLRTPEGAVFGNLWLVDHRTSHLSADQSAILRFCADQVGARLHLQGELTRLTLAEDRRSASMQRRAAAVDQHDDAVRRQDLAPVCGEDDVPDVHQRDQELQRAHDLFAGVINAATDTSIIANSMDGVCMVFSAGAERLLGYTAEEMVGTRRVVEIHDPAEVQARAQEMGIEPGIEVFHRYPRETGRSETREWTYITKSGDRRLVTLTVGTIYDSAGDPTGYIGVAQDVTEARRKDAELQQARDLFAGVINAATGTSIIASDLNGICTVFNSGAERLLGYTADEVIGTGRVPEFHDPAEVLARAERQGLTAAEVLTKRTLETGETDTQEWTYVTKSGERRLVVLSISQTFSSRGVPTGFIGVAQDITQERQAQREAVEARDLFRQLLGAATEQAIIGIDLNGDVTLFNSGAEQMLGYSREEMIGLKPWLILRTPEDLAAMSGRDDVDETYMASFRQALAAPTSSKPAMPGPERDRPWTRKDGSRVIVQLSLAPMRDHAGRHQGYLAIATDMTEQRRAERDVQEAMREISQARDEAMAANAAKSRFLATMSHEIRTPMNAVIGMTGLLLDTDLDADQRDLVETVHSSGDLLLAIINDILDFSKIEAGDLDLESRAFDLHDLVEGTMTQFAGSASGLDLISYVDDGCPTRCVGDVTRLRQVLSNLVGNAIKFTEQGDVLLRVRRVQEEPTDRVVLLFEVRDTGIGIPAHSMDRLFKSFSQVDASTTRIYGGTGLGLAISRALVTAMGGRIWVDSTPGTGSTFGFTVALERDAAVAPGASGSPGAPGRIGAVSHSANEIGVMSHRANPTGPRRVLVVDDNATVREILQMRLVRLGMVTASAAGPREALALLSHEAFDLAILDQTLPELDGIQLAHAIRGLADHERMPLILLSGIGRRPGEQAGLFAEILAKPVRLGALAESVTRALSPIAALPEQAAGPPQQAGPPTAALRILLAEDNEVNQKVGRLMLAKLGHRVEIAANGADALEAARARDFDVILMDMHMPVMDGLEATRRIRSELDAARQPTIVALTASVTREDREACAAAGMDGYLPKPIRALDLAQVLRGIGSVGSRT